MVHRNENDTYLHDEGITGVLILNLLVSSLMLLSFAAARKLDRKLKDAQDPYETQSLLQGEEAIGEGESDEERGDRGIGRDRDSNIDKGKGAQSQSQLPERPFTFRHHFTRPDTDVLSRGAGATNAYFYLQFEKALLRITAVGSIVALVCLVPVYVTAEHHLVGFSGTTVDNVAYESVRVWAVTLFVFLFTYIVYHYLSRSEQEFHSDELRYFLPTRPAWTTVLVRGVPTGQTCSDIEELMGQYLRSNYECDFKCYSVPDVATLTHLEGRRDRLQDKLERVTIQDDERGSREPTMMRPKWYSLTRVRAVDHYTSQLSRCETKIRDLTLRDDGWQRSTGSVFVTFPSVATAHQFVLDHLNRRQRIKMAQHSSADDLNSSAWKVAPAPHPFEINWEFMGRQTLRHYGRYILINFLVILIMLFFSTPVAVISALREMAQSPWLKPYLSELRLHGDLGEFVYALLPTVLLFTMASLMPYVMYVMAELEQHSTRTSMELSALRKTFLFLVINTLLLPGLLLTSLDAFLEYSLSSDNILEMLGKMFLINSGALFIHYVITSAFIGNCFDLARIGENISSKWQVWRAVTTRDQQEAEAISPFMYGLEYALILSIFAIVITFGVASPIIMPCGFLYMLFKYAVDKYNFLYVLPHAYVGETSLVLMSHSRAYASVMIMQCAMTGFLSLKGAYICAALCFLLFMFTFFRHWFYFSRRRTVASSYQLPLQLWGDERPDNWLAQAALFVHPSLRGDTKYASSRRGSVRPLTPDY